MNDLDVRGLFDSEGLLGLAVLVSFVVGSPFVFSGAVFGCCQCCEGSQVSKGGVSP